MCSSLDFVGGMLDEISLEGLDGITPKMLWQRLSDRYKRNQFSISVDEHSKKFFWNTITMHKDIEIYRLPKPRPFVTLFDRYANTYSVFGTVIESPTDIGDAYPAAFIQDGDIRGSCSTYKSRRCITCQIRKEGVLLVSLSEAEEKWPDELVMVSSPKVRLLALIGTQTNPLIDLTLEAYCLLERIGRSRYMGEVSQGTGGLVSIKAFASKRLYYFAKILTEKGLITKQKVHMNFRNGSVGFDNFFHLVRFHVKLEMPSLLRKLCDILKDKPNQRDAYVTLRVELDTSPENFRKLLTKSVRKWVVVNNIPFQEMYPDKHKEDLDQKMKMVKIVKMVKHCDEEDEDEDEDMADEESSPLPSNVHFDFSKIRSFVPLELQVYRLVEEAGSGGISDSDISRVLTFPRTETRVWLNILLKKGWIVTSLEQSGRRKISKYIAAKSVKPLDSSFLDVDEKGPVISDTFSDTPPQKRKYLDSDDNCKIHKVSKKETHDSVAGDMEVDDEPLHATLRSNEPSKEYQNNVPQLLDTHGQHNFAGNTPKLISFSENPKCPTLPSKSSQCTNRNLQRYKMLIDYISTKRITDWIELLTYVRQKEKEEGYNFIVDKISIMRLVYSLYNRKRIKIFKGVLELDAKKTEVEFICDKSLEATDPLVQNGIEWAKLKYFPSTKKDSAEESQEPGPSSILHKRIPNFQKFKSIKASERKERNFSKFPKHCRAKAFHLFLYHLVYSHKRDPVIIDGKCVYHESMTWKRFIPPLPNYGRKGCCFLPDVCKRMSLSLFLKIVPVKEIVPGLKEYLEDEEMVFYPIGDLPENLKDTLMNNNHMNFIEDVVKLLCYIGLLSFGPKVNRQREQVFLYVHQRGSFKDTTTSSPGYIYVQSDVEYQTKLYEFESEGDLENYWMDLERVCLHTPIANYELRTTKKRVNPHSKPELVKSTINKEFSSVIDIGDNPGDGLGTAGFDSSLSLSLTYKFNWKISVMISSRKFSCETGKTETSLEDQKIDVALHKELPTNSRAIEKNPNRDEPRMLYRNRRIWSSSEDSFLLLCKVAFSILDPHKKDYLVSNCLIRDLLPEHGVSDNKSSSSIFQRLRLLMSNPTTEKNASIYFMEALRDPDIVREFYNKKRPLQKVSRETFSCLLKRLLEKFCQPVSNKCETLILPNTLEEFYSRYERFLDYSVSNSSTSIFTDPEDSRNIRNFVLSSLVLSAMIVSNDGAQWSYLLHKLYQDFSKESLISIVKCLRQDTVIAMKNASSWRTKKPIRSTCPYRFGRTYLRTLTNGIPYQIFEETKDFWRNLSAEKEVEFKDEDPPGYFIGFLSLLLMNKLTVFTKVPEKIIVFPDIINGIIEDTMSERVTFNIEETENNGDVKNDDLPLLRNEIYISSPEKRKFIRRNIFINSCRITCQLKSDDENFELQVNPKDSETISSHFVSNDRTSLNKQYISELSSSLESYISPDFFKMKDDYVDLIANSYEDCSPETFLDARNIFTHLYKTQESGATEKELWQEFRKLTGHLSLFQHLEVLQKNYFVLRVGVTNFRYVCFCFAKNWVLKSYHIPGIFTTKNTCHEESANVQESSAEISNTEASDFASAVDSSSNQTVEPKKTRHEASAQESTAEISKAEVSDFASAVDSSSDQTVESKNTRHETSSQESSAEISNTEVDFASVVDSSSDQTVQKTTPLIPDPLSCVYCLKKLTDVEESGFDPIRLSTHIDTTATEVHFVPRTWRNPDGTLNKPTFCSLLSAVIGHIISNPGVSSSQVCEKFERAMPPVQTLELIEVLVNSGCVNKYYTKAVKKCSLFSKIPTISVAENPGPNDLDHLESFPDSIIRVEKLKDSL